MTGLIDPRIASAVARRISGEPRTRDPEQIDAAQRLARDLESAIARSETLVAEVSGIAPPPPVKWAIVGRGDWAEANIAGMSGLISPIADKLGARLDRLPAPVRLFQRGVISAEVGVMLGYVSRRVLGQYDVLVPESDFDELPRWKQRRHPTGGASLYFVGVNMIETQKRLKFVPEDFALWVAVHELTHRFQFEGVPWLRDRFFGLIHEYIEAVHLDAKSFARRLASAARRLATRTVPGEERNAVYLLASEEQREILDRIQALMAVVEGHGNFVMDTAGESAIPTFARMRKAFDRRKEQTNLLQRVINHAIGLEMKMRQYETGQRFCTYVAARGGREVLEHLWSSPENLPTLAELKSPERWVHRVA